MRTTRRSRLAVGLVALAVAAGVGLAGCAPPPGTAQIKVTGAVTGSANGPTVTCDPPLGPDILWERWTGTFGDTPVKLEVARQVEGDLDGIILSVGTARYQTLDHELRHVDTNGTVRLDEMLVLQDGTPGTIHLVAAFRCP